MQVGLKPKPENINIKKIRDNYEISFKQCGCETWIYLDREKITKLRDSINDILEEEDYSEIFRAKDDYKAEIKDGILNE